MKRQLLLYLILVLFSFAVYGNSGKVKIQGQIKNASFKEIIITKITNEKIATGVIDSNGFFKIRFKIESGFYFFKYGREMAYIYLYPKDDLSISFNATNFDDSLYFNGKGSERNNYLTKKNNLDKKRTENLEKFYKVNEETYLKNIKSIKNQAINEMSTFNLALFFIQDEKKSLTYNYLLDIQNYEANYKFYFDEKPILSKSFYDELSSVNLNNDNDYIKQPYYRYLVNSIWSKRIDSEIGFDKMNKKFHEIKSNKVANTILFGFYTEIGRKKENAENYFKLIKNNTNNQRFIDAANKKLKDSLKSKLEKGDASPSFEFVDIQNNKISLTDFKGKYVYIDVWATWCSPCIKQMPYLKELEKMYKNNDISFVSISVDKPTNFDTWKKMVIEKKLGGIQLFSDNSFKSSFIKAYGINSIPRFILIDKEGKIYNDKAPNPSFDKTKILLDKLLLN